jgi:hypothetical protein
MGQAHEPLGKSRSRRQLKISHTKRRLGAPRNLYYLKKESCSVVLDMSNTPSNFCPLGTMLNRLNGPSPFNPQTDANARKRPDAPKHIAQTHSVFKINYLLYSPLLSQDSSQNSRFQLYDPFTIVITPNS